MKIRRLKLTMDALSRLPENERTFLLMAGHMQNEFVMLNKLFTMCISPGESGSSKIESAVDGAQGFTIMKILAGKVYEGWQLMTTAYFGSRLACSLDPLLHEPARLALDDLKSYFSHSNLIYTVRNSFAFHYSAKQIALHWQEAASESNFDLYIGNEYGNTFHFASETAVNMAVLNGINPQDKAVALEEFLTEVQNVTGQFNNLLDGIMFVILERCLGVNLSALGVEEEVHPTKGLGEVKISFFYIPPIPQTGA